MKWGFKKGKMQKQRFTNSENWKVAVVLLLILFKTNTYGNGIEAFEGNRKFKTAVVGRILPARPKLWRGLEGHLWRIDSA